MRQTHVYNPRPPYGDRSPTFHSEEGNVVINTANAYTDITEYTVPAGKVWYISNAQFLFFFVASEAARRNCNFTLAVTPSGGAAVAFGGYAFQAQTLNDQFTTTIPQSYYLHAGDKIKAMISVTGATQNYSATWRVRYQEFDAL